MQHGVELGEIYHTYNFMLQQAHTPVTLEWTKRVSIHSGTESWKF